jgi:argininosuccinate lyase
MPFAPEYVSCVLSENFGDAQALFLQPLVSIHRAHLVMLARQGIIEPTDARRLRAALESLPLDAIRTAAYDAAHEDLFFYVERLLDEACGDEVAGRLHTARSRNDIAMTMYRMRLREFALGLFRAVLLLRGSLVTIANRYRSTVFAAHTHTQPAQPTTLAHYLLGAIEQFERDAVRLRAAYASTNRCPLGACAITGTGFPIDRELTATLLGFDSPTRNTYGSIAAVDHLLESATAAAVALAGLGRLVQDFLLWCTSEVGYLRLAEGYVQSSSIMPQKRNPVALEHARAIGSKALGQACAILLTVHNTPFGDIVDTEDDLQPMVFGMFKDATRATTVVAAAMATAEFDVARLEERARDGWITITELADTLSRDHRLPFRTAHAIAADFIKARSDARNESLAETLARVSGAVLAAPITYSEAELEHLLSPQHFVEVRRTHGGPAPEETARALEVSGSILERDQAWWTDATDSLKRAERRLTEELAGL